MSMLSTVVVLATSMTLGTAQQPQPDVTIYRSWRPPNITLVEGMFRVDAELLGTADCAYRVQLTVRDERGLQLKREQWSGACPLAGSTPLPALETFQFQVVPATYTIEVEVHAEARPEQKRTRTVTVRGLAAEPLASDLILAHAVGFTDTANAANWTLRRGSIGLQTSSQMIVTPDAPRLAYYLELYPEAGEPMTGTVSGVVKRADGHELARFELQQVRQLDEPLPVAGNVSVAELPPGAYTFETQVRLTDTVLVRAHPFYVASGDVSGTGQGWFFTLSDEQLAELFDPVVVWLTPSEADVFVTLPPDAKREFLSRQFGRQGPTPQDGQESALDAFLERSQAVSARFGERSGRGSLEPWRTDRGRVYLLRGAPAQQFSRPRPQGGAPYELWGYSGRQGYVYLFVDETRMGNFRLIYSNDPSEQSLHDWERRVGSDVREDMARLGHSPRVEGPGSGSGSGS
jgi:GWxTD domain-containing protein